MQVVPQLLPANHVARGLESRPPKLLNPLNPKGKSRSKPIRTLRATQLAPLNCPGLSSASASPPTSSASPSSLANSALPACSTSPPAASSSPPAGSSTSPPTSSASPAANSALPACSASPPACLTSPPASSESTSQPAGSTTSLPAGSSSPTSPGLIDAVSTQSAQTLHLTMPSANLLSGQSPAHGHVSRKKIVSFACCTTMKC